MCIKRAANEAIVVIGIAEGDGVVPISSVEEAGAKARQSLPVRLAQRTRKAAEQDVGGNARDGSSSRQRVGERANGVIHDLKRPWVLLLECFNK